MALDRRYLKALVLAEAGTTSHTVILARSFGIPTIVGVEGPPRQRWAIRRPSWTRTPECS